MAGKKAKGTKLTVFSGREASLNRAILQILRRRGPLICYRTWLEVKCIKGMRHITHKTVSRRMHALEQQGFIAKNGAVRTQSGDCRPLFELTLKGLAALELDVQSMDSFLDSASDEQLHMFIAALSMAL